MRKAFFFALSLFALPLLFTGCKSDPNIIRVCASDSECSERMGMPDWICDTSRGCVCDSDAACPEREHCERVSNGGDGRCHPDRSCDWNADCPEGQFCDTRSRFCRQSGCEADSQCQLGHICDPISSSCVKGCRSHGDCLYGDACLCSDGEGKVEPCGCDANDESGRLNCKPGVCESDVCGDTSFCEPGQICKISVDGVQRQCEDDFRAPYCDTCSLTPGTSLCKGGANFCLVDPHAAGSIFCGGDCSGGIDGGQECPAGFVCSEILQPPPGGRDCRADKDCKPPENAPLCEKNEDCPPGAWCSDGKCAGKCFGHEGGVAGTYCSCVSSDECSEQSCGSDGRCTTTGTLCMSDNDCKGKVVCLNNGELGFCKVGENCAPGPGLTCSEFRDMRQKK